MGVTLIEFHRQKHVCLLVFSFMVIWTNPVVPDSLVLDSQRVTCHNYYSVASFPCLNLFSFFNVFSVRKGNRNRKMEIVICPKLAEKWCGLRSKLLANCGEPFTIHKLVGSENIPFISNVLVCIWDAKTKFVRVFL